YFGTYVNKWALDGFRQLSQFRRLAERLAGTPRRYHVEFETPSSLCDKQGGRIFAGQGARRHVCAATRPSQGFPAAGHRRVEAHDAARNVAFRLRTTSVVCRSLDHNGAPLDIKRGGEGGGRARSAAGRKCEGRKHPSSAKRPMRA